MKNLEQFNGILKNSALFQMLGETGVEELKSKLIDVIIEQVRDDLADSDRFIISPSDFGDEIYDEIRQEVLDEVRQEYKTKIMKHIETKLSEMIK